MGSGDSKSWTTSRHKSKLLFEDNHQSATAAAGTAVEVSVGDADSALIRASGGVRLRQVEGNNFLGRLADAPKFAGGSVADSAKRALLRRFSSISSAASSATAAGWSASDRRGGGGFRSGTTTKHSGSNSNSPSCSCGCGGIASSRLSFNDDNDSSSVFFNPSSSSHNSVSNSRHQHHPVNLTTLLLRGFDPADYDRRWAETRRSRQQLRQQQQRLDVQQRPLAGK